MERTELARKLASDGYGMVFVWPQHEETIARIWSQPGNPELLEQVLNDPASPGRARFIAAEVLFANKFSFIDRTSHEGLARLYAEALVKRYTGHANAWGFLWDHDDVGQVGGRFMILGQAAIPTLLELLGDSTLVDWYEGSEEATVGNGHHYRIKDFAAFYLGRLTRHEVPFHADPAARDAEIDRLRRAVQSR